MRRQLPPARRALPPAMTSYDLDRSRFPSQLGCDVRSLRPPERREISALSRHSPYFVAERARFALALRPSEIQAALATTSGPLFLPTKSMQPPPTVRVGKLDDSPDTSLKRLRRGVYRSAAYTS